MGSRRSWHADVRTTQLCALLLASYLYRVCSPALRLENVWKPSVVNHTSSEPRGPIYWTYCTLRTVCLFRARGICCLWDLGENIFTTTLALNHSIRERVPTSWKLFHSICENITGYFGLFPDPPAPSALAGGLDPPGQPATPLRLPPPFEKCWKIISWKTDTFILLQIIFGGVDRRELSVVLGL